MSSGLARAAVVFAAALCSCAISCPREKWQGPSSFFRGLDRDRDGELSRSEWDAYYDLHHHRPGELCMGWDFEPADCDRDQRLTWSEYYDYRFDRKPCPGQGTSGRSPLAPTAGRVSL